MPRVDPAKAPTADRARVAKPRQRKSAAAAPTPSPPSQGRGDAAVARMHTAQALSTLVAIMANAEAPATARVSAANAVLDRAWGKPRQDVEFSSAEDPVAAIQRARQRVHRQHPDNAMGATDAQSGDADG